MSKKYFPHLFAFAFVFWFSAAGVFATECKGVVVPVIFIPGYAASAPTRGEMFAFLFQRGFRPEKLKLSLSYHPLIKTLEKEGYKNRRTLFKAVYDWRMPLAPQDGIFDGFLENVTAESITNGNFSFAVNYLGYWLDLAARANPGLEYVDVVTHSTGGLLARAYIQSPAYGASYMDQNGEERRLPKIRYLILGAAPNFGTAHSFRPWNGDFQDVLSGFIPTTEIEGRLAAYAFTKVLEGKEIAGPDYTITRESILELDKRGILIPDQTKFFRLYNPMRQSLMPIYDFLKLAGSSDLTNVNDDPNLRSEILLDLNAKTSPGDNPWLLRIGAADGQGGAIATFATGARLKTGILDFIIPGRIDENPFISTLTTIEQLGEEQGSFLPLPELLSLSPALIPVADSQFPRIGDKELNSELGGDGNAAFTSYLGNFAGDPNIALVQWGNGAPPSDVPPEMRWSKITGYPVYHDVFFFNPDVAVFVAGILTGNREAREFVNEAPLME